MAIEVRLQRGNLREPEEVEPALRAALKDKYAGMSTVRDEAILYLVDSATGDDVEAAREIYARVVSEIDPAKPTPSGKAVLRKQAHLKAIRDLDFASVKAQIDGINNVAQAKTALTQLARALWEVLALLDLNQSDIGDE